MNARACPNSQKIGDPGRLNFCYVDMQFIAIDWGVKSEVCEIEVCEIEEHCPRQDGQSVYEDIVIGEVGEGEPSPPPTLLHEDPPLREDIKEEVRGSRKDAQDQENWIPLEEGERDSWYQAPGDAPEGSVSPRSPAYVTSLDLMAQPVYEGVGHPRDKEGEDQGGVEA